MENGPEDETDDDSTGDSEGGGVGNKGRGSVTGTGYSLGEFVTEIGEGVAEAHEDEVGNACEDAADDDKGKESNAKDTAEIFDQSFTVFKEDCGAFKGSFGGFFVFTIKDPT